MQNASTRRQLNIQRWVFTLLLLCVLFMLGWLSQQYFWQTDVTANQRNSLSRGSIDLLGTLDGEIQVSIYARNDDPTLAAAVQEIMDRYARIKQDFRYRVINPDLDFDSAESAGVSQYGEIRIRYNNKIETITNLGEQAISSALLRLARDKQHTVVFLTGHGERDPSATGNRGYSKLAAELNKNGLQVMQHHLLKGEIPGGTDLLVIAGTDSDVPAGEFEHIENYLDKGGNLLWLSDPGESNGLSPLATILGLSFHPGMVVDNNTELRRTLQIQHPAIIPVLEYYPHAVSRNISYNTLFPLAHGIDVTQQKDNNEWQHQVLWRSFERSWSETGNLGEDIVFNTADGDIAGPITLAVATDRILTDTSTGKASQRVITVGDSDFLSNAYIGVGANLALANNLFNWLSGDDDLIAVDIKNANDLQLQLSDTHVLFIGAGFLVILPACLLFAGGWIWIKRRRR